MVSSDASKTPSYRGLLALVIFLGVLIVLGVGALITGAFLRAGSRSAATGPAPLLATIAAPGKHIESTQLEGNRILIRLAGTNGEELVILDAGSGRVIARIAIDPRP